MSFLLRAPPREAAGHAAYGLSGWDDATCGLSWWSVCPQFLFSCGGRSTHRSAHIQYVAPHLDRSSSKRTKVHQPLDGPSPCERRATQSSPAPNVVSRSMDRTHETALLVDRAVRKIAATVPAPTRQGKILPIDVPHDIVAIVGDRSGRISLIEMPCGSSAMSNSLLVSFCGFVRPSRPALSLHVTVRGLARHVPFGIAWWDILRGENTGRVAPTRHAGRGRMREWCSGQRRPGGGKVGA